MELESLIRALQAPQAYPHPVDGVTVVQTHISAVFLSGDLAYKVKKPVDLGFLDFTTLERRRHFCHEEVRLNRRLAPGVYLDVVPIVALGSGVKVGGAGQPVEYAVRMLRLPDDCTFEAMLGRGQLGTGDLAELARLLAAFHSSAASGPLVSRWGGLETVARNARENFEQLADYVGDTVSRGVYERLSRHTEADLAALGALMQARALRNVPREGHGDLHLAHVYSLPGDGADPGSGGGVHGGSDGGVHGTCRRLVVVDCIEFNERFRFADPVSDIAFLHMDLCYHGRPDLAAVLSDAWFEASGDAEGRALLPYYVGYRAVVRGKVDGFASRGHEIPPDVREAFRTRARAYFLLALGVISPPAQRPALLVVSGLPGTGKSVLARWLAEQGWALVSTDVVRKSLAGLAPQTSARAAPDQGIYTPEWSERTYAAVREQAQAHLFQGRRVVVEGTYREEARRQEMLDLAAAWRVPGLLVAVEAPEASVRRRLESRSGDASDADWGTYQALAGRWEPFGPRTAPAVRRIESVGGVDRACEELRRVLEGQGLL
jgi:aminoglycoside phosphotransferase family enzyme/predicted kinase